jgi:hypothetical protein
MMPKSSTNYINDVRGDIFLAKLNLVKNKDKINSLGVEGEIIAIKAFGYSWAARLIS